MIDYGVGKQRALNEARAEIDRLRAELDAVKTLASGLGDDLEQAEARLAAVIAVCDRTTLVMFNCPVVAVPDVRAAATGDPK